MIKNGGKCNVPDHLNADVHRPISPLQRRHKHRPIRQSCLLCDCPAPPVDHPQSSNEVTGGCGGCALPNSCSQIRTNDA
jgi:hypothetical protein